MTAIASLSYTNNMAANKKPLLTDFTASLDSIQTYINDTNKVCINGMLADAWPSGYAPSTLGTGRFSASNLYDKLTSQSKYTGGDITIATTGAWTDVDASNAKITITPDYLAGDFKACFQFSVQVVTSNATNEADINFRLTDGTTNSDALQKVKMVTGVSGTTFVIPVNLMYEFDSLAVALQTIKLQYYITTSTATVIKVLASTTTPIAMQVEKI